MTVRELWLVRHGESVANIAADRAERRGDHVIEVDFRDADVPLSALGEHQAEALGAWLRARPELSELAVYSSPYLRAVQTTRIALGASDGRTPMLIDERLRDRELGVLDLLTSTGVDERLPAEAVRRRWLGKFYYRPPGGESWADVALRLRSFLRDLDARHDGVVLITAHDAIVMIFLYLCLGLSEQELLDFAQDNTVANATVTTLDRGANAQWELREFAHADHLIAHEIPVTEHAGDKDADIY